MRRTVLAFAVATALTFVAVAAAAAPSGTYTTKVPSGQLKGTWTLKFSSGGAYTTSFKGGVIAKGKATVSGSKITFAHETGPGACTKAGRYSFKTSGKTLKLTRISDTCDGRPTVLARTFTKQ